MQTNRWLDKSQPQTLMMATILMYVNAAFGILLGFFLALPPLGAILTLGPVAAGFGIANEKKWGYWLGVGLAALWVLFIVYAIAESASINVQVMFNLLIYGALLALLLHPQSRSYRQTWFR